MSSGWRYTVRIPDFTKEEKAEQQFVVLYQIDVLVQCPGMSESAPPSTIWRRFSEFRKLHSNLKFVYPDIFKNKKLDPPAKHSFSFINSSDKLLHERRQQLESWLWVLLSYPTVAQSKDMKLFLQLNLAIRAVTSNTSLLSSPHSSVPDLKGDDSYNKSSAQEVIDYNQLDADTLSEISSPSVITTISHTQTDISAPPFTPSTAKTSMNESVEVLRMGLKVEQRSDLRRLLDILSVYIDKAGKEIHSANLEISQMNIKNSELQDQINYLDDIVKNSNSSKEDRLTEAEGKLMQKTHSLEEALKKLAKVENEKENLKESMAEVEKNLHNSEREKEEIIKRKNEDLAKLDKNLKATISQKEQLEKDLKAIKSKSKEDNTLLAKEILHLRELNKRTDEQLSHMASELKTNKAELARQEAMEAEKRNLMQLVAELRAELEEEKRGLRERENEMAVEKEKIFSEMEVERGERDAEIQNVREELERVRVKAEGLREEVEVARLEAEELKNVVEKEKLERKILRSDSDTLKLKQSLEAVSIKNEKLESSLKNALDELDLIKDEKEAYIAEKDALAQIKGISKNLVMENTELKSNYMREKENSEMLIKEINILKEQIENLKSNCVTLDLQECNREKNNNEYEDGIDLKIENDELKKQLSILLRQKEEEIKILGAEVESLKSEKNKNVADNSEILNFKEIIKNLEIERDALIRENQGKDILIEAEKERYLKLNQDMIKLKEQLSEEGQEPEKQWYSLLSNMENLCEEMGSLYHVIKSCIESLPSYQAEDTSPEVIIEFMEKTANCNGQLQLVSAKVKELSKGNSETRELVLIREIFANLLSAIIHKCLETNEIRLDHMLFKSASSSMSVVESGVGQMDPANSRNSMDQSVGRLGAKLFKRQDELPDANDTNSSVKSLFGNFSAKMTQGSQGLMSFMQRTGPLPAMPTQSSIPAPTQPLPVSRPGENGKEMEMPM